MKILTTLFDRGLKVHIAIFCIFCISSTVFGIEPIATIGQPLSEKHAFLNNETIVQVVPKHFQLIDTNTGEVKDEFGNITNIYNVWFSPDGLYAANVNYIRENEEYILNVWDINSREKINEWNVESSFRLVAFSPIQPILATSNNKQINLWNWKTGELIGNMTGKRRTTHSCFEYEKIHLHGKSSGRTCQSPPTDLDMVFTPDGRYIIVASMRSDIELWSVETLNLVGHLEGHTGNWVDGVAISPDGSRIATYERQSAKVYVWDMETTQQLWSAVCGNGRISEIEFSPDNQHLYVATQTAGLSKSGDNPWEGWEDNVRVFDVKLGQQIDTFETKFRRLNAMHLSPDGNKMLLRYSDGIVLWDIQQKNTLHEWSNFVAFWADNPKLSPDGKTVLSVSENFIKTWDVASQKMQLLISANDYQFEGFAISPDSNKFAVVKEPRIEIRDIQTGRVDFQFPHIISSEHIVYSQTGNRLGVVPIWRDLVILDIKNPDRIQRLPIDIVLDSPDYYGIAFSENDRYFTAICRSGRNNNRDYHVLVWKLVRNTYIFHSAKKIPYTSSHPAFTSLGDGSTILAVPGWKEIQIFRIQDNNINHLYSFDGSYPVQFTLDGNYLLANHDSHFQIWNWKNDRKINHKQYPKFISMSRDRTTYMSGGVIGQYSIWDVSNLINNLPYSVEPNGKQFVTLGQIKRNQLMQNYPNPFNPETWIPFRLADDSPVSIDIFNSTGELVRTISQGTMKAGDYSSQSDAVHWDGNNNDGESVSSGIYFYTINAGDYSATRKMLIRK